MKFLYFSGNGGDDATGESAVYPLSAFRGSDPVSATSSKLFFKPQIIGDAVASSDVNDAITVTHTGVKHQVFMKTLVQTVNGDRDGWIVVADETANTGIGAHAGVTAWAASIAFAS